MRWMLVLILVCMERADPLLYFDTNTKRTWEGSVFQFTGGGNTPLRNRLTEKGLVKRGLKVFVFFAFNGKLCVEDNYIIIV